MPTLPQNPQNPNVWMPVPQRFSPTQNHPWKRLSQEYPDSGTGIEAKNTYCVP